MPRAIRWPTPFMFRGVSAVDFTRPVSLTCKTGRPKMSQILMAIRVCSSLSHGSRREPFCFTSTPHNFVPRNRNIEQYIHLYIPALSGARSTVVLRVHFCSKRAKILSGVHFWPPACEKKFSSETTNETSTRVRLAARSDPWDPASGQIHPQNNSRVIGCESHTTRSQTQTRTHTLTLTNSHLTAITHAHTLSHTHTHIRSRTLTLTLALAHTHVHTQFTRHTTHTHTRARARAFLNPLPSGMPLRMFLAVPPGRCPHSARNASQDRAACLNRPRHRALPSSMPSQPSVYSVGVGVLFGVGNVVPGG